MARACSRQTCAARVPSPVLPLCEPPRASVRRRGHLMTDVPPEAHPNDTFDYEHNPTWLFFRIMIEFVEGFPFLARVQRSVPFFGSARLPPTPPYYQLARQLSQRLARQGYTIVTGGGPGIMQAG